MVAGCGHIGRQRDLQTFPNKTHFDFMVRQHELCTTKLKNSLFYGQNAFFILLCNYYLVKNKRHYNLNILLNLF